MLEALLILAAVQVEVPAQSTEEFPIPTVQQEVLGNILAQPIGPAIVADLALPDPFLRRFADRVTLQSFEENFRVVVADEPPDLTPPVVETAVKPGPSSTSPDTSGTTWRIALGVVGLAFLLGVFVLRRKKA